jgi:hypothetical protein
MSRRVELSAAILIFALVMSAARASAQASGPRLGRTT